MQHRRIVRVSHAGHGAQPCSAPVRARIRQSVDPPQPPGVVVAERSHANRVVRPAASRNRCSRAISSRRSSPRGQIADLRAAAAAWPRSCPRDMPRWIAVTVAASERSRAASSPTRTRRLSHSVNALKYGASSRLRGCSAAMRSMTSPYAPQRGLRVDRIAQLPLGIALLRHDHRRCSAHRSARRTASSCSTGRRRGRARPAHRPAFWSSR